MKQAVSCITQIILEENKMYPVILQSMLNLKPLNSTAFVKPILGAGWLCGTVLGSRPKGCEFDPGLQQLHGERGGSLSLILGLYDLKLHSSKD